MFLSYICKLQYNCVTRKMVFVAKTTFYSYYHIFRNHVCFISCDLKRNTILQQQQREFIIVCFKSIPRYSIIFIGNLFHIFFSYFEKSCCCDVIQNKKTSIAFSTFNNFIEKLINPTSACVQTR